MTLTDKQSAGACNQQYAMRVTVTCFGSGGRQHSEHQGSLPGFTGYGSLPKG